MKNIKHVLAFLFVLTALIVPFISQAAVSKLVFTTDQRTVDPGAISDVITVQTQDESGTEFKMEETGDVSFVSSSATGQFVNASGEPASTVMNRNSANRNFYYRDDTAGAYTITVALTTRTSQQSFTAQQTIIVGTGTLPLDDGDNPGNSTTTPPVIPGGSGGSTALSAHESPAPVSQVTTPEPFKIGAGRPRLASVHSPVAFRVESTGTVPVGVRYQWSFGDGGSAVGEQASHVYYFPGDYNIILNAVGASSELAVSRTTISVIQPMISLGNVLADRIEIANRSARELNLGGWRVTQGANSFTFPSDTIIAVSKSVLVPVANLGFSIISNSPLVLVFPDNTLALTKATTPSRAELEVLSLQLRKLSIEVARLEISRRPASPVPSTILRASTTTISEQLDPTTSPPLSASIATIPVSKTPGLFTRIKQWFGR